MAVMPGLRELLEATHHGHGHQRDRGGACGVDQPGDQGTASGLDPAPRGGILSRAAPREAVGLSWAPSLLSIPLLPITPYVSGSVPAPPQAIREVRGPASLEPGRGSPGHPSRGTVTFLSIPACLCNLTVSQQMAGKHLGDECPQNTIRAATQ